MRFPRPPSPRFNVEVNELMLKRIRMRTTTWPEHVQIFIHVEIWPVGKKLIFYSNIESGGWGWKSPLRVLFLIIFGFGSHFVYHILCYHNFLHTEGIWWCVVDKKVFIAWLHIRWRKIQNFWCVLFWTCDLRCSMKIWMTTCSSMRDAHIFGVIHVDQVIIKIKSGNSCTT